MKKLLLTLFLSTFLLSGMYAEERNSTNETKDSQTIEVTDSGNSAENPLTLKKQSKFKAFFKKINPFKKGQNDVGKYILAALLGFLLGPIGVLIIFLIFLKHENRKRIVTFAWIGWLWWLVILSILLI